MTNEIKLLLDDSKNLALENPKKSFAIATEAFQLAELHNLVIQKAYAYFHMAYACRVMSDYSNGLIYAFKALEIFKAENDISGISRIKNIIGIIYFYYGDYTSALEHFIVSLELLGDDKDPIRESAILNNMGEIYREASQLDKALHYFNQALVISQLNNLESNTSAILLNIGEIYFLQENESKSSEYTLNAYELAKSNNSIIIQGEAETKLGRLMFLKKKYDVAETYYKSALEKFDKVNNKYYLIDLLINYAILVESKGVCPRKYLIEALDYATEVGLESKMSLVYKTLAEYYERISDYKTSLTYFKSHHLKEKEVEASNLSKKLEILSIEFKYIKEKNQTFNCQTMSMKFEKEISESKKELEEIKKQNASLLEVSHLDELTQIYNRRGISQKLSESLGSHDELLDAILMFDIDHFKKYNDACGHLQGDQCLELITSKLKTLPYRDYFIGRFGGEEFICYLKVKSLDEAISVAEHIRQTVESLKLSYLNKTITISIGGKVGRMHSDKINEIINQTDQALYVAKDKGRNNVVIAEYKST
ncbi:MAG: diguanylate cyclase [Clostridiales bacterium]|nr:diguanylate cyclase [Clostridiales bacterium]